MSENQSLFTAPAEKYKLTHKQRLGTKLLDYNEGYMIAFDPGCGKTQTALDWIYRHLWMYYVEGDTENGIPDALIVAPASICGQWELSFDKMILFEGYSAEGIELLRQHVLIRSFQKTYHTETTVTVAKNGKQLKTRNLWLREDVDKPWGCVCVDECHGLGSHNGAQTEACIKLAQMSPHRIGLTGTPVAGGKGMNDYSKLFGQIMFLTAGTKWKNWTEFVHKYVTGLDKWFKPIGYNIQLCEQLLKDYAVVARLSECYDLPDFTDTMFPCPLTSKSKKIYNDLKDGFYTKYGLIIDIAGGQFTKMLQICSGNIKREKEGLEPIETDCSKEEALIDQLNSTTEKICIFCNYTASIERICKLIEKHRSHMARAGKYVVKDGHHKGDTWREFQFGDADIFIGQYASGGVGLDLFASHRMIFYEPCFSALLFTQTKARIMRKGQTSKCSYLYFYSPNTLERKVWDTVIQGFDVSERLMQEWADEGKI